MLSSNDLNTILLFQGCILETAASAGMVGGMDSPRAEEGWGAPIALLQLVGQPVVTASPWPPPMARPGVSDCLGRIPATSRWSAVAEGFLSAAATPHLGLGSLTGKDASFSCHLSLPPSLSPRLGGSVCPLLPLDTHHLPVSLILGLPSHFGSPLP